MDWLLFAANLHGLPASDVLYREARQGRRRSAALSGDAGQSAKSMPCEPSSSDRRARYAAIETSILPITEAQSVQIYVGTDLASLLRAIFPGRAAFALRA